MVIFFKIGLYFLISILSGVFFLFLVVIYLEVPGIPESLCSVHSRITCTLFPFFAIVSHLRAANVRIYIFLDKKYGQYPSYPTNRCFRLRLLSSSMDLNDPVKLLFSEFTQVCVVI